jgi:NAD-dependent SIR2 family protein deacetylase
MDGFRCTDCGHATWSFFSTVAAAESPRCPLCDGEMRPERRVPGRNRRHTALAARVDRRESIDRRTLGPVPR